MKVGDQVSIQGENGTVVEYYDNSHWAAKENKFPGVIKLNHGATWHYPSLYMVKPPLAEEKIGTV